VCLLEAAVAPHKGNQNRHYIQRERDPLILVCRDLINIARIKEWTKRIECVERESKIESKSKLYILISS